MPNGRENTGDCCSASCEWASTSDTPYICQGPELDPYFCSDPEYAIDLESEVQREASAAAATLPFPRYILHRPVGSHAYVGLGRWGAAAGVLAHFMAAIVMIIASINTVTIF